jgi:hypothetical protein
VEYKFNIDAESTTSILIEDKVALNETICVTDTRAGTDLRGNKNEQEFKVTQKFGQNIK